MFSKLLMKILVKGWFQAARCDKLKKKIPVFLDVTLCNLEEVYLWF